MADQGEINYTPPNTKPVDQLTPDQVYREVMGLKELFSVQFAGLTKAMDVAHNDMVRVPTDVQKAVGGLQELTFQKIIGRQELNDEKFSHVYKLFSAVEEARKEQKADSQIAMQAAISAVKEAGSKLNEANTTAILKSESAISKQLEQIMIQIKTETHALDEKYIDVKREVVALSEKVVRKEGSGEGKKENKAATYAMVGVIVLIVGFFFTIMGFFINYIMK